MFRVQPGAEDVQHGAGGGVEDGSSGGPAARAERFGARRADRRLQGVVEEAAAVAGPVGDGGRAEHPGLAPAARGDPDVRTGLDTVPCRDGERAQAQPLGADEGEVRVRQGRHRVGIQHAGASARRVQQQAGRPLDGLVAGDHRASAVDCEPGAAGASGQVAHPYKGGARAVPLPAAVHCPRALNRHARTSPPCLSPSVGRW
nr:hypothetical protein [Streptomyces glomeratus]